MQVQKNWAVLIYAAGANDLHTPIQGALDDLRQSGVPDSVDVLVRQVDEDGLARDFRIVGGRTERVPGGLDGVPRNGADPENLRSFLQMGMGLYPNQRIALVVNGHGQGHGGVAVDFRHGDSWMSLAGLEKALQVERPLDAVIFEACLMGSAEVVRQLEGEAHTVVASEDVVRAGRVYPRLLQAVTQSPDGPALGRALVQDTDPSWNGFSSMVAASPARAAAVETALKSFSEAVLAADEAALAELRRLSGESARGTEATGNILMGYMTYPGPRVDLADFGRRVAASDRVPPEIAAAARATAEAVEGAVDAHRGKAMSLYLPQAYDPAKPLFPEAPQLVEATGWDRAAARIAKADAEAAKPPSWGDLLGQALSQLPRRS